MQKLESFIKRSLVLIVTILPLLFSACGGGSDKKEQTQESNDEKELSPETEALADPMKNKGVGPVEELNLEPNIDQDLAAEGKKTFEQYCTACHKIDERFVGPPVKEVTVRRSPEWIMNMILNPEGMIKEDPIAKQLLQEYKAPMANQNLTEQQARSVLEYFRTLSEVDSLNH